jgi:hypothetical protein
MKKTITLCFILFAFLAKAQDTLHLKFFIEGYYIGGGMMRTSDTATVELHNNTSPFAVAASFKGLFLTNGTMACNYSAVVSGHLYYIGVRTRNALVTWSALPVAFNTITNYDFTTSANQAYGGCMDSLAPGVWAFTSGDINQDQNIDLIDFPALDFGRCHGLCGYYPADLNGDGNIDIIDYAILDQKICLGTFGSCNP